MNPGEFTQWLKGFMDALPAGCCPTMQQIELIKAKLATVKQ